MLNGNSLELETSTRANRVSYTFTALVDEIRRLTGFPMEGDYIKNYRLGNYSWQRVLFAREAHHPNPNDMAKLFLGSSRSNFEMGTDGQVTNLLRPLPLDEADMLIKISAANNPYMPRVLAVSPIPHPTRLIHGLLG